MKNRVVFYISNDVHILDLAGPLQVFYESGEYGIPYDIIFVSDQPGKHFSSGLSMHKLRHFSRVPLSDNDLLIIPGFTTRSNSQFSKGFYQWLHAAHKKRVRICSVCTGIFALAKAGILDGLECTTHWKYIDTLQKQFPKLHVIKNRLFIKSHHIYTSAGITTGIDLALFLIEESHGAKFAYVLAKELVVYMRRDSADTQESTYLQHRQHINYQVHEVQDWIVQHLHEKILINELADKVNMSPRNLTRLFKSKTGTTIGEYITGLRVEKAMQLLKTNKKVALVAKECGLKNRNQLIAALKKHTGHIPKEIKRMSLS